MMYAPWNLPDANVPEGQPWTDYGNFIVSTTADIYWIVWGRVVIDLMMLFVLCALLLRVWLLTREGREDRLVIRGLLTTIKGWAVVVTSNDREKAEKLEEVAKIALQAKEEIKQVIIDAVADTARNITASEVTTAEKVVVALDAKASGLSDTEMKKPPAPDPDPTGDYPPAK